MVEIKRNRLVIISSWIELKGHNMQHSGHMGQKC